MKLIHPPYAEVVKRIISLSTNRHALSYGLILPFSLHERGPSIPSDFSPVWPWVIASMGEDCIFDEAWPKARGEFLAYGAGYMRDNRAQPLSVRLSVGKHTKELAVFGDRRFKRLGTYPTPEPFVRMPVSPQTAFGGSSFSLNPLGKGAESQALSDLASSEVSMPNIELPTELMIAKGDRVTPAGFWSYPPHWPQRTKHLGSFDDVWQKNRWPHLPLATSSDYYQTAPADQQLNGFFQGDETVEIYNMHPQFELIATQLPSTRARVFVAGQTDNSKPSFREVVVHRETVWLFPDQLSGLLLFRAVIDLDSEDADDIDCIYADFEKQTDVPETLDQHYKNYSARIGRPSLT